jgi:electron transfer flavoprotein alpha subunit
MKVLLIAEHDHRLLKPTTRCLLTAAEKLASDVDVLVIGEHCDALAAQAACLPLQKRVLVADHAVYAHLLAENTAALIASLCKDYDYVLMAATTTGKNILPRVAALLDVAMLSEVMGIKSADTFVRPIYAGNVLATVQSSDKMKLMTVRTTAFPAMKGDVSATEIVKIPTVIENTTTTFESESLTQSSRPELTAARVIISGGRGLKSAENFKLLENIADRLGAAIGASRAAVDAGFAPNDYQVGQTGKIVAPELYIAVGISGAIQHMAGMKDSKVIVAINNDPEAPIMQMADYTLVGDLFEILPAIAAELDKTS